METRTLIIHCVCCDSGTNISEVIQESFRLFLQRELGVAPRCNSAAPFSGR